MGYRGLEKSKRAFLEKIRDGSNFWTTRLVFVSEHGEKQGTRALFPLIKKAYANASKHVGAGELNRFVETLKWEYHAKIHYITPRAPSDRPPLSCSRIAPTCISPHNAF